MTKIIAEFCQNHLGNRQILEEMIIVAKKNGASHAKIQGLYSSELTKRDEFENPQGEFFRPYGKELERLSQLDLDAETEEWFVKRCVQESIIPMITVFTHKGVERAKKAGFKSIKIASYDCGSIPMIEKVLEFALEIVISTGATYWEEIKITADFLHSNKQKNHEIALLHAKTIYPTKLNQFSLLKMVSLNAFGFNIGLSDHTKPDDSQLIASKVSILLGATYIERHFTILDRLQTKDGPISITPKELQELSRFSRLTKTEQLNEIKFADLETVLACSTLEPDPEEILNRKYYRGRVASTIGGKIFYSWEYPNF